MVASFPLGLVIMVSVRNICVSEAYGMILEDGILIVVVIQLASGFHQAALNLAQEDV